MKPFCAAGPPSYDWNHWINEPQLIGDGRVLTGRYFDEAGTAGDNEDEPAPKLPQRHQC
jgi:hypothetical protein